MAPAVLGGLAGTLRAGFIYQWDCIGGSLSKEREKLLRKGCYE